MGVIAVLDVLLGARVDGFEGGMKKAAASLEEFVKAIPGGAIALGVFAAATAEVVIAAEQINKMFGDQKLTERLGLGPGELAAFKIAAAETGGSIESLIKPMEKLGIMVAEAGMGNATAIQTFDDLGLSFEKLHNMTKVERLKEFGEALQKIKDTYGSDTADALSRKILGKGFGEAKLEIEAITKHFDEFQAKAADFGLVLTPEQQEANTSAKLSMDDLDNAWEGLKTQLTIFITPLLELGADVLTFVIQTFEKLVEGVNLFINAIQKAVDWIMSWFGGTKEEEKKTAGASAVFTHGSGGKGPGAAEQGSAQAFEIIAENLRQRENPVVDKLDEVVAAIDKQTEVHEETQDMWSEASEGSGGDF